MYMNKEDLALNNQQCLICTAHSPKLYDWSFTIRCSLMSHPGHLWRWAWLICKDAVGVFYSPSRLGWAIFGHYTLTNPPGLKLHHQMKFSVISRTLVGGGSDSSAEMQSAYSTVTAKWISFLHNTVDTYIMYIKGQMFVYIEMCLSWFSLCSVLVFHSYTNANIGEIDIFPTSIHT